ncbi:hypothetical protein MLD52_07015 [Puniceicoccaceae bacterium K14]|nr:hypothetical protein [Puniceicoccaceae bacterium K14]
MKTILTEIMKEMLRDMAKQERIAWVVVIFDLLIAIYYFSHAPLVLEAADLYTRGMRKVVMTCFILMVIAEIIVGIVSWSKKGETVEDERDVQIKDKSVAVGYRTMLGFVVILIGHIVFFQGMTGLVGEENARQFPALGELGIANVLMGVLILSTVAQHIAKIFYYRKMY